MFLWCLFVLAALGASAEQVHARLAEIEGLRAARNERRSPFA